MAGPKKGSTTARGRTRRDHILEVALRSFAERGYRGASMGAIAAEVGITEPGLLHHFPSKSRLLIGVFEYHEQQFALRVRAAAEDQTFADGLLDLARRHEADPTFIRFFTTLAAESTHAEHPAHEWFVERYRRIRGFWTEAIRNEQAAGRMRSDVDAEALTNLLIAVFDGIELQHLLDPQRVQIAAPLAVYLRMAAAAP